MTALWDKDAQAEKTAPQEKTKQQEKTSRSDAVSKYTSKLMEGHEASLIFASPHSEWSGSADSAVNSVHSLLRSVEDTQTAMGVTNAWESHSWNGGPSPLSAQSIMSRADSYSGGSNGGPGDVPVNSGGASENVSANSGSAVPTVVSDTTSPGSSGPIDTTAAPIVSGTEGSTASSTPADAITPGISTNAIMQQAAQSDPTLAQVLTDSQSQMSSNGFAQYAQDVYQNWSTGAFPDDTSLLEASSYQLQQQGGSASDVSAAQSVAQTDLTNLGDNAVSTYGTATGASAGSGGDSSTPSNPGSGGDSSTPSNPGTGGDTTPTTDGEPSAASSLSTNPADYGATQQIEFNPATMVNVQDYGAVGDGQTDDTAAFNSALAAANAAGKSVYVPNGTYDHNGQIDVTGSAGLIGQSSGSVLEATDTAHGGASGAAAEDTGYSNRAIDITGSGATVEDLTLTANSTIPRYGGMEAIAVNIQGSDDTVNGVTVDGGNASQSNFTNGIVVNALNGNLSNEKITNNLVENTNADYIRVAAWNNNGNNDVSNVLVQGNMAFSTAGAALGDDDFSAIGNNGATITDYQAINNVAIGPKQWGNMFDMEGVEGNSEVVGNYINDEGGGKSAGVVVQVPPSYPGAATNGLSIADNYFSGDGSTNSNFGAVALWNGADNISISNNTFTDSDGPDISATGSGDSAVLAGNTDTSGNLSINDQEGALKGQ